jgi:hypothetical protein
MANIDPLAPVIQALSVLVAPDPPLNRASPQQPGTWTGGSNTATDGTLYTPAKALLGVLFGASADLTSLGNSINTGLTDVATVIASIAGQLGSLAAVEAQLTGPTGALTALQTVLGLAQMVAPSSTTGVLQSAEGLFQQIQSIIAAYSLAGAAAEMGELSQQLTAAAPLFPAA